MKETRRLLIGFVVFLLPASFARPQGVDADFRVTSDPIQAVIVTMTRGTPVVFTFHIKPGFHVNSHQPIQPEMIATVLNFSPPEDLMIARKQYPDGVVAAFAYDPDNKHSVYSGDIAVKALVLAAPKASPGSFTVHGELKYQACDSHSCYPPKILPIKFDVKISSTTKRVPRIR